MLYSILIIHNFLYLEMRLSFIKYKWIIFSMLKILRNPLVQFRLMLRRYLIKKLLILRFFLITWIYASHFLLRIQNYGDILKKSFWWHNNRISVFIKKYWDELCCSLHSFSFLFYIFLGRYRFRNERQKIVWSTLHIWFRINQGAMLISLYSGFWPYKTSTIVVISNL